MNEGQMKFRAFILANVRPGMEEEAEKLLAESFRKQADGTFNGDYVSNSFMPRMLGLIKDESLEQVKGVMVNFQKNLP